MYLTDFLKKLYHLLQVQGRLAAPILAEVFVDEELRQSLYRQLVSPITNQLTGLEFLGPES